MLLFEEYILSDVVESRCPTSCILCKLGDGLILMELLLKRRWFLLAILGERGADFKLPVVDEQPELERERDISADAKASQADCINRFCISYNS